MGRLSHQERAEIVAETVAMYPRFAVGIIRTSMDAVVYEQVHHLKKRENFRLPTIEAKEGGIWMQFGDGTQIEVQFASALQRTSPCECCGSTNIILSFHEFASKCLDCRTVVIQ